MNNMDPMAVPEILFNMSDADSQARTYFAFTPAEAWRYCLKGTLLHFFLTGCARSKPQFQNTSSATVTLFPICYLSHLKHLDMNAIVLGKHARCPSFIKPKPLRV